MVSAELAYSEAGPVGIGLHVISDEMPALRHMADNKYYTSKHKFRETTKAYGCLEVGTDPAILRPRKPIPLDRGARREAIRKTIYELRNGIRR
jgi:hypothetical protein